MKVIIGCYRALATTLYLIIFGIGGLFVSTIAFRLISLFIRDQEQIVKVSRALTRLLFNWYLKSGEFVGIFKFNFHNLDKLKNDKNVIYIANHPSLLDFVILTAIGKNTSCVVKNSLKKNPFFSGVICCNQYIGNHGSSEQIVQRCKDELDKDSCLIIFPEGTRTRNQRDLKFTHGFSSIALTNNYNIRPIVINFKGKALRKSAPWYLTYYSRLYYDIEVLDLFDTQKFVQQYQDKEKSAQSRILAKQLQKVIKSKLT